MLQKLCADMTGHDFITLRQFELQNMFTTDLFLLILQ
jgi:hypothetical protein